MLARCRIGHRSIRNRGAVQVLDAVRSSLGLLRVRDGREGCDISVRAKAARHSGGGRTRPHARPASAGGGGAREAGNADRQCPRVAALLSHLLVGSFWPTLEVERQEIDEGLDVFVDPAGFDLALFELAVALKQCMPAGRAAAGERGATGLAAQSSEGCRRGIMW